MHSTANRKDMCGRIPFLRTLLTFVAASAVATVIACTTTSTSITGPDEIKCSVNVTSAPTAFPANGGAGTLTVGAARDCSWTVSSEASWLTVVGTKSGQGDGTVPFNVAANVVPTARAGSVAVGPTSIQLSQAAAACRYTLARTSDTIAAAGGKLTVDLSTLTGCAWTASTTDAWIAITGGQSGSADGMISLTIAANTGALRVGQVRIGDQTFTVTQAATGAQTPPPNPTPTPPPPTPTVHFEGKVSLVTGRCPTLSFLVDLKAVTTDASTTFKKGDCTKVSNGDTVVIDGVQQTLTVKATTVEFKGKS